MSVIRQYGNIIINLTKIISVKQVQHKLFFTMPISNYFNGGFMHVNDSQQYEFHSTDEQTAREEMKYIKNTLDEYYKNHKN